MCALKGLDSHTGIFCPCLRGGWTGLSQAYGIARHDSELVLDPGVQTHHRGRQHVPIDHLRHCNVQIRPLENQAAAHTHTHMQESNWMINKYYTEDRASVWGYLCQQPASPQ